jgi:hypothetical protein
MTETRFRSEPAGLGRRIALMGVGPFVSGCKIFDLDTGENLADRVRSVSVDWVAGEIPTATIDFITTPARLGPRFVMSTLYPLRRLLFRLSPWNGREEPKTWLEWIFEWLISGVDSLGSKLTRLVSYNIKARADVVTWYLTPNTGREALGLEKR